MFTEEEIIRGKEILENNSMLRESGCIEYTGIKFPSGYGRVQFKKKTWYAHRLSYTLYKGEITKGLHVCHKCDNPCCINPEHLFLGTVKDNMQDRDAKGRGAIKPGMENPNAHIPWETVLAIRETRKKGFTNRELAVMFGVSQQHVSSICLYQRRAKC